MKIWCGWVLFSLLLLASEAFADREDRLVRRAEAGERYPDLALRLQNPLARVLVLPVEVGYQQGGGNGPDMVISRFSPRIPFVLNDDWHLVSKSDFFWAYSDAKQGVGDSQGFSDITQSFLLSPDNPIIEELYWGSGISMVLPVATDSALASKQFSLGPSLGVYRQREPWTLGMTAAHVWSVAGESSARNVSATRMEPAVAFTAPTGTTIALSSELTYDWLREDWQIPIELTVSQLTLIRERPVTFGIGVRYWVDRQLNHPSWSAALKITVPLRSPRWGPGWAEGGID